MGFSRQEHQSGLPHPPPGYLPDPVIEPLSHVSCIGRKVPSHWHHPRKLEVLSKQVTVGLQFSSVTQLCPTPCDPIYCSMSGLPVHYQLPGFTQTHVHCVSDVIQPSDTLSSSSSTTFNLSKHQGLFKWVSSSHQVAKVLEFQLQHQSFQLIFTGDFLED